MTKKKSSGKPEAPMDDAETKALQVQLLKKQVASHELQVRGTYFAALVAAAASVGGAAIKSAPPGPAPAPATREARQIAEPKQENLKDYTTTFHLRRPDPVGAFLDGLLQRYAAQLQSGRDLRAASKQMLDELVVFRMTLSKTEDIERVDSVVKALANPPPAEV